MVFYFNGESILEAGKIIVDLGCGPFRLENRIDAFCNGASNVTIWAVWDCSRKDKQKEAGVKKEWSDDDQDGSVPIISTYACQIGQTLPANSNFVIDLSKHLRLILERE